MNNKIVLTIDVEDWFHSLDTQPENWKNYKRRVDYGTKKILELLSESGSSATFFILGDVAKNSPELIKQIHSEGHEIGSHGFEHKFIYNQTPAEFRNDLKISLNCLTDIIGDQIVSFRAPYFSITQKSLWAFDILRDEGIQFDSSIFPVINHRYGIPGNKRLPYRLRNGIWEFPITTYKTFMGNIPFSGGVYFRFLPLSLSTFFMNRLIQKQEPVLLYFHPWEFDPEQPIMKNISAFLLLRHYYGLKNNFKKLTSTLLNIKSISLRKGIEKVQSPIP